MTYKSSERSNGRRLLTRGCVFALFRLYISGPYVPIRVLGTPGLPVRMVLHSSCCSSLFGRLCGVTPDQVIACPQDAITPGTNQLKVVVVLPFLSPDQPPAVRAIGLFDSKFHKVLLCLFSLLNKSFLTVPSVQAGRPLSTSGWLKGLNKTTGHVRSFYPFQKDTRPVAVAQ